METPHRGRNMSLLNGAWARSGWGEKLLALAGLVALSALSAGRALVVFPAMVGTARTLLILGGTNWSIPAFMWVLAIEFLFGGSVALMLGSSTDTPMAPWFLGALALMVALQDDRRHGPA